MSSSGSCMKKKTPLRVVQLSDFHLFADPSATLLGLSTQSSFESVLELVRLEQPQMDVLLATGDLSQDASAASYARAVKALEAFNTPVYWLEGNHDKPAPLLQALEGKLHRLSPCVATHGNWTFILLDSTIPGDVPGELFQDDLTFLAQALADHKEQHVMVCLHHHPVPIGCRWLDEQRVNNAEAFFQVIDQHTNVRAIVWGHVHQEFAGQRRGVELYAVPSTCIQFKPHCERFTVDTLSPGYRWFDLYPDGRIVTEVSRVEEVFHVDFASNGY